MGKGRTDSIFFVLSRGTRLMLGVRTTTDPAKAATELKFVQNEGREPHWSIQYKTELRNRQKIAPVFTTLQGDSGNGEDKKKASEDQLPGCSPNLLGNPNGKEEGYLFIRWGYKEATSLFITPAEVAEEIKKDLPEFLEAVVVSSEWWS